MALNSNEVICREFHFDTGGPTGEWTTAVNGSGSVSLTGNSTAGAAMVVSDLNDRAFMHFNGRLCFDIDDILAVESLIRISQWDDTSEGFVGLCSGFNTDPDAIAESAWFKIAGGATGRNLVIETDDGTTNNDDIATGIVVPNDTWMRLRMDFANGIQSIAPPGSSKGGKASILCTASDENGVVQHIKLAQHLDMSAYSGGFQPIFGARQITASTVSTVTLNVKSFKIWLRQAA